MFGDTRDGPTVMYDVVCRVVRRGVRGETSKIYLFTMGDTMLRTTRPTMSCVQRDRHDPHLDRLPT